MTFLLITLVILIFAGIPTVMYLENKEIKDQHTDEEIIIKLKEENSWVKKIILAFIAAGFLLLVNPEQMTVEIGFMKIMLIFSIYIMDEFMKTKFYITNKNIYVIEHFRNRKLIFAKRFEKGELYKVEKTGERNKYAIHYFGQNELVTKVKVKIKKEEDMTIVKGKIEELMETYIDYNHDEEALEKNEQKQVTAIDKLAKNLIWMLFIFSSYGVIRAFTKDTGLSVFEGILVNIIAIWFIPFSLYFFSYVFLKSASFVKDKKESFQKLLLYFLVASSSLTFVPYLKHNAIEGSRHMKVFLVGMLLIGIVMALAWITGKFTKYLIIKKEKRKTIAKA